MKKWECLVCGYIHEGEEPPDECPVCGADKEKFVEIKGTDVNTEQTGSENESSPVEAAVEVAESTADHPRTSATIFGKVTDLILENHLHPISVHSPNGIVPVALIFLLLAVLLQSTSLENAAYYNLIAVLFSMPPVLFTGYATWHKKYKGAKTSVFKIKIAAGSIATVSLLVLVVWRTVQPDVVTVSSSSRWLFLLLSLVLLASVGIAGHFGGKLVFASKK